MSGQGTQRVLDVCQEALGREGADREAFLDQACAGDPKLRHAVEALLREQAGLGSFLAEPAWRAPRRLETGTRLGPYQIQAFIGAGGMGEVYKARDTRLERTVAIKVLPPDVAAGSGAGAGSPGSPGSKAREERRARFEREARTIAALSHPHICALYDVGREGDTDYLVMEHLAGETLGERIRKGPLPVDEALALAGQIADALAAAHRQGVIHRDLKPGNVMVTRSGGVRQGSPQAKLLDFGLAKLGRPGAVPAALAPTALPTVQPLTAQGLVLGTVPYMSPEQVEGKEADARSDVFAFGAVLYEMLTGRRAFEGDNQASIITAIMASQPPPVSSLRPVAPRALDRVVAKCLAKDPERRWQTADDLADEIRWVGSGSGIAGTGEVSAPAVRRRIPSWRAAALVLAGLCVGAGVLAAWWAFASSRVPRPAVQRLHVSLPEFPLPPTNPAISPDGQTIVFRAMDDSVSRYRLFARAMSDGKARVLEGTDEVSGVCFSPAGDEVAFVTSAGLFRASLAGGPPIRILEAADDIFPRFSWSADGFILFTYRQEPRGVWRVPARGGQREVLVPHDPKRPGSRYRSPQMLPDGSAVLFVRPESAKGVIVVYSMKDRTERTVTRGDDLRYLPETGHLAYLLDGNLLGARFNASSLAIEGQPLALERDVSLASVRGAAPLAGTYDVSRTGTLVYVTAPRESLVWRRRNGGQTVLPVRLPGEVYFVSLSPDGRSAVLTVRTEGTPGMRLFMATLEGADPTVTPMTDQNDWFGTFSCDGRRLLFTRQTAPDEAGIYSIPTDRSAEPQLQVAGGKGLVNKASSFACPGDTFLFNRVITDEATKELDGDVWEQRLDKPETARRVIGGAKRQIEAAFSPDRRWIAYTSETTGRYEVYVEGYPSGAKTMISTDGGSMPVWHPRGDELFYQRSGSVFSVRVENGRRVGPPSVVFLKTQSGPVSRQWDLAPDGDRFLVAAQFMQPHVNVIVNWAEELRAKVR